MMHHSFLVLLLTLFSLKPDTADAQERCGSTAYNKSISPKSEQHFEAWLETKIARKVIEPISLQKQAATVYEIPVVVHVIHNGEALGSGVNIPNGQIISQIEVLNEDFRRLNADRVNTPVNFQSVAADIEVEFVLAKRDPEGLATTGIIREVGSQSSWGMSDNVALKQTSYWPSEDYLNLWVTDVAGSLLGFAQFPQSDDLDGLEDASANALTDGAVIDYQAFGSIDKFPEADLKSKFNKGRTATHEIGHFLGLRHTWGDATCGTDYCEDTPTQRGSTSGCPSHPKSNSCGTSDEMFENYMDYTNDVCMNLFTIDQKDRIRTVLENSPRRQSLTTSLGILEPVVYDYDLGLFSVVSPGASTCDQQIIPEIIIKNYGNIALNEIEIQLKVNNTVSSTMAMSIASLSQLSSTTVSFPITNLTTGDNKLEFEIISVNNNTDQGVENNAIEYNVNVPSKENPSIDEDFEQTDINFSILNFDSGNTWAITNAPDGGTANNAVYLNYFNDENQGSEDWLISNVMDFQSIDSAVLLFEYAHANFTGRSDNLKVLVSTDCGASFQPVFNKSGTDLSTVDHQSKNYVPSGSVDWHLESIDLTSYTGLSSVQIAFAGVNGFGNNIYLDNIELITSSTPDAQQVSIFPNPIFSSSDAEFSLVFNLDQRQPIEIRIFDVTGSLIFEQREEYALNQTYTYDASELPSGMLILSIIGRDFQHSHRLNVIR